MNKKEIIKTLELGRAQFLQALEGLSEEQMQQPGVVEEWSVKDLLAHLSLWEAELITMLYQLKQGQKPSYPTLNNQEVDRLNEQWFRDHRARPLERVRADFLAVRKQTIRQVERYT